MRHFRAVGVGRLGHCSPRAGPQGGRSGCRLFGCSGFPPHPLVPRRGGGGKLGLGFGGMHLQIESGPSAAARDRPYPDWRDGCGSRGWLTAGQVGCIPVVSNVFSTSSPLSASDRIWTGLAISDQSGCPSIDTLPRMRPVSPRARAVRSVIFQILRSMSHFAPIAWACVRTVRSPNPMLT